MLVLQAARADDPTKAKRIAVFPLKTAAGINHWWEGDFDPGQAMTETLITVLANSPRYAVMDRENLDKIAQEQNLGIGGQVTPETAAQVGKLLGIRYIVTGAVTEFGEVKQSGMGGISWGGISVGGGGKRVRIVVEVHVTDVNSGMISAALRGQADAVANGSHISGWVPGTGVAVGGGSQEFASSKLGEAMRSCADQIGQAMETISFKEVEETRIDAAIIDISGSQITLNVGSKQGVVRGMKFQVTRARTITDPTNGSLKTLHSPVGTLEVTSVDDDTCTCRAAPGANPFKVKDVAKLGG
jgi:curli biogenesis system outer membrane secretion channel CsgG